MTRCVVLFSGRVQGVGFRATAASLARGMELAGFVRNLADGRVELVVEGGSPEVERLLGRIRNCFADGISATDRRDGAATGEFSRFEIRR